MKFRNSFFVASMFLSMASMAAIAGCSDDTSDVVDDGQSVSDLAITPGNTTLTKGASVQFHAVITYADGTTKDVSSASDTTWNTSDADVATVSDDGMVTAVDEGAVSITADFKGVKESEDFIVVPQ